MKRRLIWFSLLVTLLLLLTGCSAGGVDGSIQRMMAQVDAGNYINAADIYEATIYGNTEREYETKQELDARLTQALSDYNTGEKTYDEANNVIETIERVNVLDFTTLDDAYFSLLALQQSKAAFDSAEALFAAELYSDALENYQAVLEEDTNYAAAQQKATEAREYFLAEVESRLNEYLDDNDYDSALNLLDEAHLMLPDEVSLDARETEIRAKYLNYALEQAGTVFSAGKDYESAIRVITAAQNRLGDNDRLAAALTEYQSYIPVYLNELEYFDKAGDGDWTPNLTLFNDIEDNYGNVYSYGLSASSADHYLDQGSIRYYIAGNYTSFTGTLVVPNQSRQSSETGRIEIYGDGVLLYSSPSMVSDSTPIDFSVDISDVSFLNIVFYPVKWAKIPTLCDGLLTK